VISSIITLPTSFAGYFAGFISDRFGFVSLFLVCIIFTAAGISLALRIKPIKAVIEERRT
jgi:hypothetical protein